MSAYGCSAPIFDVLMIYGILNSTPVVTLLILSIFNLAKFCDRQPVPKAKSMTNLWVSFCKSNCSRGNHVSSSLRTMFTSHVSVYLGCGGFNFCAPLKNRGRSSFVDKSSVCIDEIVERMELSELQLAPVLNCELRKEMIQFTFASSMLSLFVKQNSPHFFSAESYCLQVLSERAASMTFTPVSLIPFFSQCYLIMFRQLVSIVRLAGGSVLCKEIIATIYWV